MATDIVVFDIQSPKCNIPLVIQSPTYNQEILEAFFGRMMIGYVCGRAYSKHLISKTERHLSFYFPSIPHLTFYEDNLHKFFLAFNAQKAIGIQDKLYLYTLNQSSITQGKNPLKIAKRKHDIQTLQNFFQTIINDPSMQSPQIQKALKTILFRLRFSMLLENRFDDHTFAYPKALLHPYIVQRLSIVEKIKILPRISIYLISFGKIKI